jgi:hypothetical protein
MDAFLFLGFTLFSAISQGIITWLFREFVPPKYNEWVDAALHKGGVLLYGFILSYVLYRNEYVGWLATVILAVMIRLALFDLVLNLTKLWFNHREGRSEKAVLFEVGTTALTDRIINKISDELNITPSHLRVIIWIVTSVAIIILYGVM